MTTLPGTVGAGTAIEAKTMDAMGNITPVYSEAATKPALMSVYFGIGAQKSGKINTIYLVCSTACGGCTEEDGSLRRAQSRGIPSAGKTRRLIL